MAQVYPSVKNCSIIFKYLHWTPDRKGKRFYVDKFDSIATLKDYFTRHPAAGALVRCGKMQPGASFAFEAGLGMKWTDQKASIQKEFKDVFDFVEFLKITRIWHSG